MSSDCDEVTRNRRVGLWAWRARGSSVPDFAPKVFFFPGLSLTHGGVPFPFKLLCLPVLGQNVKLYEPLVLETKMFSA